MEGKELEELLKEQLQEQIDYKDEYYNYWQETKKELAELTKKYELASCPTGGLVDRVRNLEQQLADTEESYNRTMAYLNIIRSELLNLPKKIVEEIKEEIYDCGRTYLKDKAYIEICIVEGILAKILKKY